MKKILTIFSLTLGLLLFNISSVLAQPANDACASAEALAVGSTCVNSTGDNTGATASGETPSPTCSSFGAGMDQWYSAVVPASGIISIEMSTAGGPTDWAMAAYSGTCGGLTQIECDDDDGPGVFPLLELTGQAAGSTILIRVWEYSNNETGAFSICAFEPAPPPPAPANDECVNAAMLTESADNTCANIVSGTTVSATQSSETSLCSTFSNDDDVWYEFMPANTVEYNFEVSNTTTGTYVHIYSGTCAGGLTSVGGCFATGSNTADLVAGTTYLVQVHTSSSSLTSDFDLCAWPSPPPPPPPGNDACAGAISIVSGGMISGDNSFATIAENPGVCSGGAVGAACASGVNDGTIDWSAGLWYVYNSTGAETITFEVSGFDTELQVFQGPCGALTCIAGDDDSNSAGCCGSQVCIESTASFAPVDYYIYVDGHGGATGVFTLSANGVALPIELISFDAVAMKEGNKLSWSTATEANTESHIVQRSVNGRDNWTNVGSVAAKGFSTERTDYELMDDAPIAKAYYRLNSVDFSKAEQISETLLLEREGTGFSIASAFPNPTAASVLVQYRSPTNSNVEMTISDITGKVVSIQQLKANDGLNELEVDLSELSSGTYFLTLSNDVNRVIERIVKQ